MARSADSSTNGCFVAAASDTVKTKGRSFNLFVICLVVSVSVATFLQLSGLVKRAEMQTINSFFECRRWLYWTPESINRLNPAKLWQYHQQHEIPRKWWAWDYTLSWLIENNHPPVQNKYVMFNHSLQDEPPPEALQLHPWMQPLMQYPVSRNTIADSVTYLAKAGAKAIVLDNDFPQYSKDDANLARAIHESTTGALSGKPVPVFIAATINHNTSENAVQVHAETRPEGLLTELEKLERGVDVREKYTGLTSMTLDEDLVIRRMATRLPKPDGGWSESMILKILNASNQTIPDELPPFMDIDFIAQPNSELYPVRPFFYLLDPEKQKAMKDTKSDDATIDGAICFIGDGVIDVYSTPYTNLGVNLMSGTEILAQAIDTVSRKSWPTRLSDWAQWFYLIACTVLGTTAVLLAHRFQQTQSKTRTRVRFALSLLQYGAIVLTAYCIPFLAFAYLGVILPAITPALALGAGALATVIVEREHERLEVLATQLQMVQSELKVQKEMHEAELKLKAAEAKTAEFLADQRRRKEFVRTLNHDLKAPVTVLNWTLHKLRKEGFNSPRASERVDHLEKTSDRLFGLIAELVRTYDWDSGNNETAAEAARTKPAVADLTEILTDCTKMQRGLAEERGSEIISNLPPDPMQVTAVGLELSRVFDNIIRNALIHNPPGICVDISARTRANIFQVNIADNGKGIPSERLISIFEKGVSYAEESTGSDGLGLSIAKNIIENYGGTITVESEVDVGTTFTIVLPCRVATTYEVAPVTAA